MGSKYNLKKINKNIWFANCTPQFHITIGTKVNGCGTYPDILSAN